MGNDYDVIIVGGRCAGAALGARLALAGVRTLMVDAAKMPSDMVLSTHYLHPPAIDELDHLGVGDKVRASIPPTRTLFLAADDASVRTTYPDGRAGYSVRRFKLDAWLQEAATAAGAEFRDRCRVVELLHGGGRVRGVVIETPAGRETITGRLVVGADGPHSTVARLTDVEEYLGFDMTRGGYWFYWPATEAWRARDYQMLLAYEGGGLRYVFQTDDDLLLMAGVPGRDEARGWGSDFRERYITYMAGSPYTAQLVAGNQPVSKGCGYLKGRCFYRRPVGPGFALVGDAGTFKDFVTGHGIGDALISARQLAAAILEDTPQAFELFWRRRDVDSLPLYFDAQRLGDARANTALLRLIVRGMGASPALANRFALVMERRLDPAKTAPTSRLLAWVLWSCVRGRIGVLRDFLAAGAQLRNAQKEIRARRRMLARAESTHEPEHPELAPAVRADLPLPPSERELPSPN
jgi:flavin-dependent dehydrogenase